jgi:hypothetical protein
LLTVIPSADVPGTMVGATEADDLVVRELLPHFGVRGGVRPSNLAALVQACATDDRAILLRCDLRPNGEPRTPQRV